MRIEAKIDNGALRASIAEQRTALAHRMRAQTEATGRSAVLEPLRRQVTAALGSKRLANTWRGNVYPRAENDSLSPAFFTFSKAPEIVDAFERGVTITPNATRYLAIPTPAAGRAGRATRKGRLTPQKWMAENGVKLRFVRTARGGVLIADKMRAGKGRRAKIVAREKPEVIFILVKQVRLKKTLDLRGVAQAAGASYASSLERAANSGQ